MKGTVVCVTGANGFIGRKLVDYLVVHGCTVRVLSRRANCIFPAGVQIVRGDLTSAECPLNSLVQGCSVVFHCAGEIREVSVMERLHVGGTQRLLQAVLEESTAQKKGAIHYVHLSSVGAYGPAQGAANLNRIVTEDTPVRPLDEYEVTKTRSDALVIQASASGLITYSILRPSNVFGADMPNQSLRQLGVMIRKRLFFYIGRPGAVATYVHISDVVEALIRCGFDHRAKGNIFNISNDCLLEDMAEGIASALGVMPPRIRMPERVVRAVASVTAKIGHTPLTQERINALVARTRYPYLKLARELDFTPRLSVPNAMGEVVKAK